MAKVVYSSIISGLAGKIGNSVNYRARSNHFGYIRSYAYPRITDHMHTIGAVAANLTKIWHAGSDDFKNQLKQYCDWYKTVPIVGEELAVRTASPFSLWLSVMYKWAEEHTDIDLETITMEDFSVTGIAVSTVKNCIQQGYLLTPPWDYSTMTAAF